MLQPTTKVNKRDIFGNPNNKKDSNAAIMKTWKLHSGRIILQIDSAV